MAGRTNAISLRLSETDRAKLKTVADRLEVREADILRYAIDMTLSRLGPLQDRDAQGVDLLPLFVESGAEMLRFFSIDSKQLERIINEGVAGTDRQVDSRDIALLVRSFREEAAAIVQLHALLGSTGENEESLSALRQRFRDFLYRKYLFHDPDQHAVAG
ncbi:MAG: hypothetical protein AAFN07_06925 [Pseudomonadota bacterium]